MNGKRTSNQNGLDLRALAQRLAQSPKFKLSPQANGAMPGIQVPVSSLAAKASQGSAALGAGAEDLAYLLHHGTMGFSLVDYYDALPLGWNGWLDQQLDPDSIDDSAVEFFINQAPTLGLTPPLLFLWYPDNFVEQVIRDLQTAVLLRAIYSKRQLYERMVTFWTDHLNISQLDDLCLWLKTVDDREVIRKHALGTFPEMLMASAKSPAMLWYLDNYANAVGAAQENYARELLELHTLGVDGPYTEHDVREVARCFTGWTLGGYGNTARPGKFTYVHSLHDTGAKTVLGVTIPAGGGIDDGERVIEILAAHPKTAEFVSRKMCRWLLMYEPPAALVSDVANVYLQTGGDIKSMIRTILDPDTVKRIPVADRTKLRQPLHFMIATLRATLVNSVNLLQITFDSERLGQTPYWWPSPDGPPDSLDKWGGSVLPRWEFAARLFDGQIHGNVPETPTLRALLQYSPGNTVAERMNFALTGGRLDPSDVEALSNFFQANPVLTDAVLREGFALAVSSPSFQFI